MVLVTDHDAFDYDLVTAARAAGAGHQAPPGRSPCRAALAARPHIAVILSGWPRVSESFALNEVLALHRAGLLAGGAGAEDRRRRHPAPGRGASSRRWSRCCRRGTSRPRPRPRSAGSTASASRPCTATSRTRRPRSPRAVADKFGVPYGFSVHALDARKVSKDELGDRARRAAVVVTCNEDAAAEVEAAGITPDAGPARRRPGRVPGHPAGRARPGRAARGRPAGGEEGLRRPARRRWPGWTGRTGCGWSATARCGPGWRR